MNALCKWTLWIGVNALGQDGARGIRELSQQSENPAGADPPGPPFLPGGQGPELVVGSFGCSLDDCPDCFPPYSNIGVQTYLRGPVLVSDEEYGMDHSVEQEPGAAVEERRVADRCGIADHSYGADEFHRRGFCPQPDVAGLPGQRSAAGLWRAIHPGTWHPGKSPY